jgi:hypothetical protein
MARSENLEPHHAISTIFGGTIQREDLPSVTKHKTPETNPIPRMRPIIGFRDHELEDEVPNEKLTHLIVDTINCRT